MQLLVTGGAGYIGSVVARTLLADSHDVVIYDNLSHGHRTAVPAGAEFVLGDVGDPAALGLLLNRRKFDAVLHFAGSIEAGESMKYPERYFRNNSANTLTLLERVLAHGIRRVVFSSTAAVYGEPVYVPLDEVHQLQPTNAYGESKLIIERMLKWFHDVHGLRYASLRYFNAAGALPDCGEAHEPETHLIPLVLSVATGVRPHISVFGTDYATPDGTCVRDYIHVQDLADAHLLALRALAVQTRVICNLGTGSGFSVRELIDEARKTTGHPIPVQESARRPGDPAVLVASCEKAKRELGWNPSHSSLREILHSAWTWEQAKQASSPTEFPV
jgi:UDP-glucose 4-epimerase